jgi:serine phosphatase RsbU (regulator of sigma subunit)
MNNSISETRELISRVSEDSSKHELEQASSRFHIIAAWVAIIFDPVFAATDFINIPQYWKQLLIIRLSIAAIIFVTLMLRKRLKLPSYAIVMVPFLLISVQNAYTYSLIGNDVLLGHSLNYMALLIGAAMFVLWPWTYSLVMIVVSALATAFFLSINPAIDANTFFVKGGLLLVAVGVFMLILIRARYNLTLKEITARLALKESNEVLKAQKSIIESKNEKITDSIRYAKRIQDSILGHQSQIDKLFRSSMVMFRPKDILSGDFFWFYENAEENVKIIIAADCTGHGVPAAMMTVLGNSILNDLVIQNKIYEPAVILKELDLRMIETFNNEGADVHKINDGMDVSILCFDSKGITFAAANNPLCAVSGETLTVIAGSKFPIGSTQYKEEKVFHQHTIDAAPGTRLFIFTDGYQDQFGGEKNSKFLTKRFRELLRTSSSLQMTDQKQLLEKEFDSWKGDQRQTDDVLVIGVEV